MVVAAKNEHPGRDKLVAALMRTDSNLGESAKWAGKLKAMLKLVMRQQVLAKLEGVPECCALPIWLKAEAALQILCDPHVVPEAKANLRLCAECQSSPDGLTIL